MDIIRIINRAWSEYETPVQVSSETYDDEGTHELFHGTRFDHASRDDLWMNTSSLTFFTDSAFRYYLASYLIFVVKRKQEFPEVLGALKNHLSAPKGDVLRPSYADRVGKLTLEQKQCVLTVLESAASSDLIESDDAAISSIRKLCM